MRDINEANITDAVIQRLADTPDPRLKQIVTGLVRHLHDYVRDVEPSFEEWQFAIDYLTRVGQTCTDKRQEFILLSDTLGVSMLVDAINHRLPEGATETTVLGPFFVAGLPELPPGTNIAGDISGEPLFVGGKVMSAGTGHPLAGAVIDAWQSDDDGYYDVQRPELTEPALRGRFRTDANGYFHFWSITPHSYPIPDDGPVGAMIRATKRHPYRPAHVHFMISAEGHETLVTHIFAEGDPYLDSDAVFGVKDSLIQTFAAREPGMAPDGRAVTTAWRTLERDFGLKPT